ncbi:MAG: nucleotidyl transferase AbiEii/AbiGii toxin family protein [Elusimicrobiales bacterium]
MDFEKTLRFLIRNFKEKNIDYALIGGFALGVFGITRTTIDMDFLVDGEKVDELKKILNLKYKITNENENVLQFSSKEKSYCSIDFLVAKREISKNILKKAVEISVFEDDLKIKVARKEDIIGLKVQAIKNNPKRYIKEIYDIEVVMERYGKKLNWEKIEEYFRLFDMGKDYEELRDKYEK